MRRGGLALALLVAAGGAEADDPYTAWRFTRPVTVAPGPEPLVSFDLPPELLARARPGLADLRLLDASGTEVPYVLDARERREEVRRSPGRLVDTRVERRLLSVWTADLGAPRRFHVVVLDVAGDDFAKAVQVEGSADGRQFTPLARGATVFDRSWRERVRRTSVLLPGEAEARFVRVTADDRRSAPIALQGLAVEWRAEHAEARWTRAARLVPLPRRGSTSRYRVVLEAPVPFERIEVGAGDPVFQRRVRLVEERGEAVAERGAGLVYRLRTDDAVAVEERTLGVLPAEGGDLLLEVEDADSPPLRAPTLTVGGPVTRLLFPRPPGGGGLALRYGNPRTRAPLYDVEPLRTRMALARDVAAATLGAEEEVRGHRPALPLPQLPARGAVAEVRRYAAVRAFEVPRDDLYELRLDPGDLAWLRSDLADLRVVDAEGRQVPYVLGRPVERPVALRVVVEDAPPRRTRLRLHTPKPEGRGVPDALPLVALELEVADAFFTRPARVLGRDEGRPLHAGELRRTEGAAGADPVRLPLDGRSRSELVLEMEDGDNAPLSIVAARGVVAVPRLAFQAAPGPYRVLLGDAQAAPPRYDIAALREHVLALSAVPLAARPVARNPQHRRTASDLVRQAPPTLLLWSTLGAGVAALLLLTVRALRQPNGGAPPGTGP